MCLKNPLSDKTPIFLVFQLIQDNNKLPDDYFRSFLIKRKIMFLNFLCHGSRNICVIKFVTIQVIQRGKKKSLVIF